MSFGLRTRQSLSVYDRKERLTRTIVWPETANFFDLIKRKRQSRYHDGDSLAKDGHFI